MSGSDIMVLEAGTAAAVSLKNGVHVSNVNIADVQKLLIKRGVKIK